ncbi:hypothetical protein Syun_006261 [Stephania yunnanensis]|uniref:Uncharacterized protein n=1 Tax=Stephania yunnanensis TaxID=152371 RepID=A0AAP0KXA6_9MAGN
MYMFLSRFYNSGTIHNHIYQFLRTLHLILISLLISDSYIYCFTSRHFVVFGLLRSCFKIIFHIWERKSFFFLSEGKIKVNGFEIPLDNGGELLERFIKATENFTKPLNSLSTSDFLLASP